MRSWASGGPPSWAKQLVAWLRAYCLEDILICVPSHHCVGEIGQIWVVTLYLQSSLYNLITNSSKKLKHYLFIICALWMWECSHLKGRLLKLAQDAFKWGGDIQITPREGQITGTSARWGSLRLFWELFASPRETLHKYSVGSSLEECLQSNDAPQASNELWRARLSCSALSFRVCRALSMATPSNSAFREEANWIDPTDKWIVKSNEWGREEGGEERIREKERGGWGS